MCEIHIHVYDACEIHIHVYNACEIHIHIYNACEIHTHVYACEIQAESDMCDLETAKFTSDAVTIECLFLFFMRIVVDLKRTRSIVFIGSYDCGVAKFNRFYREFR